MKKDVYMEHYKQLIGKRVVGILKDENALGDMDTPIYGLKFDDGTVANIACDPEINGAGFLDIFKLD